MFESSSKASRLTKENNLLYWLFTANVIESKILAIGKVETLTLLDQVRDNLKDHYRVHEEMHLIQGRSPRTTDLSLSQHLGSHVYLRDTLAPSWVQAVPGLLDAAKVEVGANLGVRPTTPSLTVDWVTQTSRKAGPQHPPVYPLDRWRFTPSIVSGLSAGPPLCQVSPGRSISSIERALNES